MARIAGRNGSLYANLTSGGTAEPIAYLDSYSINFTSDRFDVTSFGDSNKAYVAGLPDAQGDYSGFYDTATAQLYTAATDGIARKTYIYLDRSGSPGTYFWGTAFFDMSIDTSATDSAKISGSWSAATPFLKVG